jgi:outer membrane protein assembly factor BamB
VGVTQRVRLECLLRVPRAPGGGPPLSVEEDPQTSLLGADAPSPLWSAPRLRVSPDGAVALLAADGSAIVRFDASGGEAGVTPLQPGGRVVDHVAAAGGGLVVLGQEDGRNVLRGVDADGRESWVRRGPAGAGELEWEALAGSFGGLLADGGGQVYLAAERPRAAVARIDEEGALVPVADVGPPGAPVQMDAAGTLYSVGYDPQSRRRSWNRLDPATGERDAVWCDPDATAVLALPIGVDRDGRAYAAEGMSVACVDGDGSVAWRFTADGIVPREDGTVVSATAAGPDELDIITWNGEPVPRPLPLPRPADGRALAWRLIGAAPDGGHVVWGGAGNGPDALATLGPDGEVRELLDPAPDDARLRGWWPAAARDWRVDADGRVYVAAAGPDAVAVLRLNGPRKGADR